MTTFDEYFELNPEQYSACLAMAARWTIREAVQQSTALDNIKVYSYKQLLQWASVLPSEQITADFDAILEVYVNGLESDYMAHTLPLPVATWYLERMNGSK